MVGVERRGTAARTGATNVSDHGDICPDRYYDDDSDNDTRPGYGEFDWDKREQGLVMGSYYWSYTAAQIPAAWLATKYGFRQGAL